MCVPRVVEVLAIMTVLGLGWLCRKNGAERENVYSSKHGLRNCVNHDRCNDNEMNLFFLPREEEKERRRKYTGCLDLV